MCVLCVNVCFPLAYRFASCRNFWAWISKCLPKPLFFLKRESRSNSTRLRRADTRNLSQKSRFSLGGVLYVGFKAGWCFGPIFRFVVHLWSLKKVAERNFVSKRLKYVSMGECLLTWALYFWHFHVVARFQKFDSLSRIFWANVLFAIYVCTCILMFFLRVDKEEGWKICEERWVLINTQLWLSKPLFRDWGALVCVNFSWNFCKKNPGATPLFFGQS